MHYLLTAAAKTLSLPTIAAMSDEKVEELLRVLRWRETEGRPVCPECGCDAIYTIRARSQYRCKRCSHTFSVTSGTVFHAHKLPLRSILMLCFLWGNAVKGVSALQMRRDIGLSHKAAYVLLQKMREALFAQRDKTQLEGEVEIDGMYVGGKIRKANKAVNRPHENWKPTEKKCVLAIRQRDPNARGALRTLVTVAESESEESVVPFVTQNVAPKTTIFADEHASYHGLAAWYDLRRVNHSREYRADGGEHINLCESLFIRFRRLQLGQTHKLTGRYLLNYAYEVAYRDDHRRWSNGAIMMDMLGKALRTPACETWRAYWRKRRDNAVPAKAVQAA